MASIVGRAPGRPGAAGWAWLSCWRSTAQARPARTRDGQIRRDVFMRVSSDDPTVSVADSPSNADRGRCGGLGTGRPHGLDPASWDDAESPPQPNAAETTIQLSGDGASSGDGDRRSRVRLME